ncbi:ras-related protein Rab-23-like [Macrobrachium nipponense]|uniref:ras-related protein Rab-23-like n=1 Tax=Macrobrachium nipponense TaxID=159736 RepID=UPI0030C82895
MTIMREEDLEIAIKVVIVGNGAVGKSSMIQRYCKGTFTKDYKKTIGVDFLERQITTNGEEVRLMLWDTAGQEEFDAITKAYYRGAQACVVAFSTTDRDSFTALKKWKKKVEDECGSIPMVLVQNKIDLIDQATVKPEEVESFARDCRMRLYRTSVKEDLNVDQVFNYLVERYLALISQPEDIYTSKDVTETIFGNPAKLKKGDTITLNGKKKSSKKQLIKNACKVI